MITYLTFVYDRSGAACEAAKEGIPSIATSASGSSTSQISYTTLTSSPTSSLTKSALTYATLGTTITQKLLSGSTPILPANITLNVNYPATSSTCASASNFKWVLSRITASNSATDVQTCGTTHLPTESSVVATSGCFISVSVMNAVTKADVDASTQAIVLNKLSGLLSCLP
jgi:5'-nucleotidase